jgi:peptidoglycan/xylan/chitin deacetylase (PgdA/CDA1 family)
VTIDDAASREHAYQRLATFVRGAPEAAAAEALDELEQALATPTATNGVLGWEDLRSLVADGLGLANHTCTHPVMPNLPDARLVEEIDGAQEAIRSQIGDARPVLAYPGGAHDDRVVAAARRAGMVAAFTTAEGGNDLAAVDPLRLRRLNIGRASTPGVVQARMLPLVERALARTGRFG